MLSTPIKKIYIMTCTRQNQLNPRILITAFPPKLIQNYSSVGDGRLTVVVGVVCVCNLVDKTQFKSGIFVGSKLSLDFLPNFAFHIWHFIDNSVHRQHYLDIFYVNRLLPGPQ